MPCAHSDTTAVLAAFGEAPPDFERHLDACAECQAVMDLHRETLTVVAPALPSARPRTPVRLALIATAAALAAGLLLTLRAPDLADAPPSSDGARVATVIAPASVSEADHLDDAIAALEMDLALLDLED